MIYSLDQEQVVYGYDYNIWLSATPNIFIVQSLPEKQFSVRVIQTFMPQVHKISNHTIDHLYHWCSIFLLMET